MLLCCLCNLQDFGFPVAAPKRAFFEKCDFKGSKKEAKQIDRAMQGSLSPFLTPTLGLAAEAFSYPRIWGQRVVKFRMLV